MSYLIKINILKLLTEKKNEFKFKYNINPKILILSDEFYNLLKEEGEKSLRYTTDIDENKIMGVRILKTPVKDIINYY